MNPSTKLLVNSFIKNSVNSIGFKGPKNSGKFQIAKYLSSKTLKITSKEFDFNVEIIDCANQSGIDDIRDLKKKLAIKPAAKKDGFSRAVILQDFHKISIPAQNSILKLLEEPPLDTILILLVDTKGSILPTIVSRLQWVDVLPLDLKTLEKNYSQFDSSSVKQAYLLSDGYLIDFEKILKKEKSSIKLAVDDVKKILKLNKTERISNIDAILDNQDYSPEEFLTALQKIYSALMRREIDKDTKLQNKVLAGLDQINKTKESLKYNANSKLIFTNLFYKI